MYKKIYENLLKNGIDLENKRVVAGFSGGPDSMLLLLFLLYCRDKHNLCFKITHMNHNERMGAESEESIVHGICREKNIEASFYSEHTGSSERRRDKGFEMAGREARRKMFLSECAKFKADYIFTGHNLNDSVETFLINIERGTGIRGVSSNRLQNGKFVKPLIFLEKDSIKDFLIKNKISFIEDETNNNEKFARNRIRKNIIPILNSSIAGGLGKFKRFFENTDSVLMLFDFIIEDRLNILKSKNPIILDISKILYYNNKLRKNLLYYILSKNLYVDSSLIESIDRVISSKKPNIIFKEKGMIIEKSYNDLKIEKECKNKSSKEDFLKPGMEALFNGYTVRITKTVFTESLFKEKNVFVFPLSAGRRFRIRALQTSDSFVPFGMNKEKKVSRFLMDNKTSLSERKRIPLILNEKNEILAVGSLRRTELYRMKKQKGCLCIYVGKN